MTGPAPSGHKPSTAGLGRIDMSVGKMKMCVCVGERKKAVEYWLFTCKQNTNVFTHGDFGGRGGICHSEFFSFRTVEEEIQFFWELEKCPGLRWGWGWGLCKTQKRGDLICEGKATVSLKVLRWEAVCRPHS